MKTSSWILIAAHSLWFVFLAVKMYHFWRLRSSVSFHAGSAGLALLSGVTTIVFMVIVMVQEVMRLEKIEYSCWLTTFLNALVPSLYVVPCILGSIRVALSLDDRAGALSWWGSLWSGLVIGLSVLIFGAVSIIDGFFVGESLRGETSKGKRQQENCYYLFGQWEVYLPIFITTYVFSMKILFDLLSMPIRPLATPAIALSVFVWGAAAGIYFLLLIMHTVGEFPIPRELPFIISAAMFLTSLATFVCSPVVTHDVALVNAKAGTQEENKIGDVEMYGEYYKKEGVPMAMANPTPTRASGRDAGAEGKDAGAEGKDDGSVSSSVKTGGSRRSKGSGSGPPSSVRGGRSIFSRDSPRSSAAVTPVSRERRMIRQREKWRRAGTVGIMADPIMDTALEEHATRELRADLYLFMKSAEAYHLLPPTDPSNIWSTCINIVDEFIMEGAPLEIDLSPEIREEILYKIEFGSSFSRLNNEERASLFNAAAVEVRQKLDGDLLRSFLESQIFVDACKMKEESVVRYAAERAKARLQNLNIGYQRGGSFDSWDGRSHGHPSPLSRQHLPSSPRRTNTPQRPSPHTPEMVASFGLPVPTSRGRAQATIHRSPRQAWAAAMTEGGPNEKAWPAKGSPAHTEGWVGPLLENDPASRQRSSSPYSREWWGPPQFDTADNGSAILGPPPRHPKSPGQAVITHRRRERWAEAMTESGSEFVANNQSLKGSSWSEFASEAGPAQPTVQPPQSGGSGHSRGRSWDEPYPHDLPSGPVVITTLRRHRSFDEYATEDNEQKEEGPLSVTAKPRNIKVLGALHRTISWEDIGPNSYDAKKSTVKVEPVVHSEVSVVKADIPGDLSLSSDDDVDTLCVKSSTLKAEPALSGETRMVKTEIPGDLSLSSDDDSDFNVRESTLKVRHAVGAKKTAAKLVEVLIDPMLPPDKHSDQLNSGESTVKAEPKPAIGAGKSVEKTEVPINPRPVHYIEDTE